MSSNEYPRYWEELAIADGEKALSADNSATDIVSSEDMDRIKRLKLNEFFVANHVYYYACVDAAKKRIPLPVANWMKRYETFYSNSSLIIKNKAKEDVRAAELVTSLIKEKMKDAYNEHCNRVKDVMSIAHTSIDPTHLVLSSAEGWTLKKDRRLMLMLA